MSRPPRVVVLAALAFTVLAFTAIAAQTAGETAPHQPGGPTHARGFDLENIPLAGGERATVLTVRGHGEGAARYLLVPRGAAVPDAHRDDLRDATIIRTPLRRVVTLSSTYLPALEALGVADRIVGHDRRRWVYSPEIRARMAAGDIAEVGSGGSLDTETLLALEPEVVLTYDAGTAAENPYPELEGLDLTTLTTTEFREATPLGRSEWILALAALFDREDRAREVFADIEERYRRLQRRADAAGSRPTVFLNGPWGSTWAMPEGENYSAVFLEHAGAAYVFSGRPGTGTLFLDFETVLARAGEADFWLNPGQYESRQDALAEERRFRLFEAFREGRVFNNDARVAPSGGNDYFESGYLYADRVLADLIAIFHPALLPDHELFYYRRLP